MAGAPANVLNMPRPPVFANAAEERLHRKQMLAAAFRLFSKFGFDEGVAGHITARDAARLEYLWVHALGMHFGQIRARPDSGESSRRSGGGKISRQWSGFCHPFPGTRRAPRCDRGRARAFAERKILGVARSAAGSNYAGCLRVLRGPRIVRGVYRRGL